MAGVETTGFVRKLHADCVTEIVTECRGTVDAEWDDSPDSATGQLSTIVGAKHAELWEVVEAVYNSLGPSASSYSLDRIAALSNSKRKDATPTLLLVTITGTDGSNAARSIDLSVDGQDVHFTNRNVLAISSGTGTGIFECDTTGPVRVLPGTLGPNVTTFSMISQGQLAETDPRLRVRRRSELADEGTSTVPAIRAALSKLENVLDLRVYSNRTFVVDSAGRPPKSLEAVLLVVDDADAAMQPVADTIWANLPAGIESHGTETLAIVDEEGHSQDVKYSLATPVNLWMIVSISVDEGAYPGNDAVRTAIADFTSGGLTITASDGSLIDGLVDMGGVVARSKLAAAALTVPGVRSVTGIRFSDEEFGNGTYVEADYALSPRAYLGIAGARGAQSSHILVQALPA
jgi:hypothetical protein